MTAALTAPPATCTHECTHTPPCPAADAKDRDCAHPVVDHHEQGWVRLCNGVVLFDDGGDLEPNGQAHGAQRGPAPHRQENQR